MRFIYMYLQKKVNADPVNLNNVLDATVYDESGKEVVRPLTWEARQLDGIKVTPGCEVNSALAASVRLKFCRTASRTKRN